MVMSFVNACMFKCMNLLRMFAEVFLLTSAVTIAGSLPILLISVVFSFGRKITMKSLGQNMQTRTAKALKLRANEITAVCVSYAVVKKVGMKASQIKPRANVVKAMYLDSWKFAGKRMVRIAKPLQAMSKAVT